MDTRVSIESEVTITTRKGGRVEQEVIGDVKEQHNEE